MIRKLDHLVITTADMPACIAFYERLGFRANDAGGRFELFAGDFKINVHQKGHELEPKAKNAQTGSADLCFEIEGSLAHYKNILAEHGVSVELGIVTRHGVKGEMQSLYLRDPDENLVELSSYE